VSGAAVFLEFAEHVGLAVIGFFIVGAADRLTLAMHRRHDGGVG
jgi:hypothetical protein